MESHYNNSMNEINITNVEDKFIEFCEDISAQIEYGERCSIEVDDFEDFKPFIKNWEVVEELVKEENENGCSDKWSEIKF